MHGMKRDLLIVLVLGLFACIALYLLFDIYVCMIGAVLVIALAMSLFIMQDTSMKPNVMVFVEGDAKGIRVRNKGNAKAVSVKVSLASQDLHFDIPVLEEDAAVSFPVPPVREKVKVTISFQNEKGDSFAKSLVLAPDDVEDEDILKPIFPIFGWK